MRGRGRRRRISKRKGSRRLRYRSREARRGPPPPPHRGGPPSVEKDGEAPAGGPASPEAPKPVAPARNTQPEPVKPIPKHEHGHRPKEIAHEAKLLENRGLWAILAGVAIVVLFVVILFVTGGSDDSNSSGTTTASASQSNCERPTGSAPKPTGKIIAALASGAI